MLPESSNRLSHATIIVLSIFSAICLLCFLAFTYTILRQKLFPKTKIRDSLYRFSYDTFESQTTAPSILIDEHFVQPPDSNRQSTTNLSLVDGVRPEGLRIPIPSFRRYSDSKTIQIVRRASEKGFFYRPINSCIQFSHSASECLTLHLSISYVHTVELLKIVIDKVSGLHKEDSSPKIYILQFRVMPKSRTSAYLSKPLVTPAAVGNPEFDHSFEYNVSLKRLEGARIEATLLARHWSDTLPCGQRRYTIGPVPYTTASGLGRIEVNSVELMKNYKVIGRTELVLDPYLIKNNPEAMEHLALPLEPSEGTEPKDMEESEKE
ncbi:hypothetical protein Aperf_G00000085776 [Anoplocephala perfoliata]